jgi:hypothetical protein
MCIIIAGIVSVVLIQKITVMKQIKSARCLFLQAKQFAYKNKMDSCKVYINKARAISDSYDISDFTEELLKLDSTQYIEKSLNFVSDSEYVNITKREFTQPGYHYTCFLTDTGLNKVFYEKLYKIRDKRIKY